MKNAAKKIATIALMAATLTGGKMALAFVPNVEIVSILLCVYAYVFGFLYAFPCALIFCTVEVFIWGLNTWALSYFIYWSLVSVAFSVLGQVRARNWQVVLAIALTTFSFGVLTSMIDVGLLSGNFDNFWGKFAIMYGRGFVFFAIHIVSNIILFSILFKPFKTLLTSIKQKAA